MSVLIYNGVCIPYTYHAGNGFSQSAVFDDSQTDRLYTRFDLRTQGIINVAYKDVIGVEGNDAATLAKNMRKKLMEQRKRLSVKFGDVEMIPTTSIDGIDAKNGPLPQAFNYTLLTDESFLFDYAITAHYAPEGSVAQVLSNRWTDQQTIDGLDGSTWTRSGKFITRSDGGATVDSLRRQMAMLAVPKSFLRQSSTYTVSEDGLRLQYSIVDKECYKRPPEPAFKASGKYRETTSRAGGKRYGTVNLRLEGSRLTEQADLVKAAVFICLAKLNLGGPLAQQNIPGFVVMESTDVEIDMYENVVSVSMRAFMKPRAPSDTNARLGAVASINFPAICKTPNSDANTPAPDYDLRGTASILLQAAAYWDPLLKQELNAQNRQINPGREIK